MRGVPFNLGIGDSTRYIVNNTGIGIAISRLLAIDAANQARSQNRSLPQSRPEPPLHDIDRFLEMHQDSGLVIW